MILDKIDSYIKLNNDEYLIRRKGEIYKIQLERIREYGSIGYRVYKKSGKEFNAVNVGNYPLVLSCIGSNLVQEALSNM